MARVPSLIYLGLAVLVCGGDRRQRFGQRVVALSLHRRARFAAHARSTPAGGHRLGERRRRGGAGPHARAWWSTPRGSKRATFLAWGGRGFAATPGRKSTRSCSTRAQTIAVDLWDGRREWLPKVGERAELAAVLERIAMARAIPISGGTGMFDPPEGARVARRRGTPATNVVSSAERAP